ncbi:hypothetical protein ACIBQ1_33265 [Nonomuraea sp. NPDC050153]|uniref:hypothetical protein n=1 Tax=Nonomuraea sp. NPDC050153 TaxID=3364359 RepID=UPI00379B106E
MRQPYLFGAMANPCVIDHVSEYVTERGLPAKAACRVSRWAARNGEKEAVRALVERLSAGQPFPGVQAAAAGVQHLAGAAR